jgi:hypothetical protein
MIYSLGLFVGFTVMPMTKARRSNLSLIAKYVKNCAPQFSAGHGL